MAVHRRVCSIVLATDSSLFHMGYIDREHRALFARKQQLPRAALRVPNPAMNGRVWRLDPTFYMRNANTTGFADISVDTSASAQRLTNPSSALEREGLIPSGVPHGLFLLRDSNIAGGADYSFALGVQVTYRLCDELADRSCSVLPRLDLPEEQPDHRLADYQMSGHARPLAWVALER